MNVRASVELGRGENAKKIEGAIAGADFVALLWLSGNDAIDDPLRQTAAPMGGRFGHAGRVHFSAIA